MPNAQFPYPRKSSIPSEDFRTSRTTSNLRPRDLKQIAIFLVGAISLTFLLIWVLSGSSSTDSLPLGGPAAVIVTTIDPSMSDYLKENIIANRKDYATRHGYETFFPNTTDYNLMSGVPRTWSKVPAIRHAMTLWPHTPWLFYLASTALIMNPHESLHAKLLEPDKLESLMIVDKPVVPPDSVIKTFPHLKGDSVDFVLTQDKEGLAGGSMLIRTGEWAKYLLDSWFDPLYRSYNFQKAENHALEHIVQWHGTVLAKLALVPQRVLNSYTLGPGGDTNMDGIYHEGDFVANFESCLRDAKRNCEEEMQPLLSRWRELRDQEQK